MKDNKKKGNKITAKKEEPTYDIVIDNKPRETNENTLFLGATEMSKTGVLNQNKFSSCTIKHTDPDDIRPSSLLGIYQALKPFGKVEVYLQNPILVMQPYEAKMIDANAKLAGFEGITSYETSLEDEDLGRTVRTTVVRFGKPGKREE